MASHAKKKLTSDLMRKALLFDVRVFNLTSFTLSSRHMTIHFSRGLEKSSYFNPFVSVIASTMNDYDGFLRMTEPFRGPGSR